MVESSIADNWKDGSREIHGIRRDVDVDVVVVKNEAFSSKWVVEYTDQLHPMNCRDTGNINYGG